MAFVMDVALMKFVRLVIANDRQQGSRDESGAARNLRA
jgi:hypothetical protein